MSKGLGIATTGPVTDAVPVSGVRNAKIGNVAMVKGKRKLLILSRDGKSQIPYAYGGTMTFDFSTFGTGSVTVKSIKVNGMSKTGGTVQVYSGTTSPAQIDSYPQAQFDHHENLNDRCDRRGQGCCDVYRRRQNRRSDRKSVGALEARQALQQGVAAPVYVKVIYRLPG